MFNFLNKGWLISGPRKPTANKINCPSMKNSELGISLITLFPFIFLSIGSSLTFYKFILIKNFNQKFINIYIFFNSSYHYFIVFVLN